MEKPGNVPANANWNPENNQWELGQYNAADKKVGRWQTWHQAGHLNGITDYKEGNPPFRYTGYHPDGTISQEGDWYGGQQWRGTYRWFKSENPTTEHFPLGSNHKDPNVWIVEFDYLEEDGVYNSQRYFNKALQPVSIIGAPLPPRPASVPERAHFVDSSLTHNHKSCWVASQINGFKGKCVGPYDEWDEEGKQAVKRVYDYITFEVLEEHQYNGGILKKSIINGPGDQQVVHEYYEDLNTPVIRQSKLIKNNKQDKTLTFFDETGKTLYSARQEVLSDLHKKRYYNNILTYEGNLTADPISVRYYSSDGTIMIEYLSGGNGSGNWQLYEEGKMALTIAVADEKEYTKRERWEEFLTYFSDLEPITTEPEWEQVKNAFKEKHAAIMIKEQLAALPVPEFLQQELKKIKWDEVEVAMYGNKTLPMYINGLFADNDQIAATSTDHLWMEIEHQGSLYEATYIVATIVARCRHHYKDNPAVYDRLMDLLFSILSLPGIDEYKKYYKQLIKVLSDAQNELFERATDTEDIIATKAYYLLLHAGQDNNMTATFLQEQWIKQGYSLFRRSYALFTLGELYLRTKQEEKLVSEFSAALETTTDRFIRLILALQLVTATKKQSQDAWLAELISAVADHEHYQKDFNELHPYIGDYDMQEYMLMVLRFAKPGVLKNNIAPVIEMLPQVNSLKQETLMNVICSILFPNKSAFKQISPLQKQALHAIAKIMDTNIVFINHTDVLEAYSLPKKAAALRELANK